MEEALKLALSYGDHLLMFRNTVTAEGNEGSTHDRMYACMYCIYHHTIYDQIILNT